MKAILLFLALTACGAPVDSAVFSEPTSAGAPSVAGSVASAGAPASAGAGGLPSAGSAGVPNVAGAPALGGSGGASGADVGGSAGVPNVAGASAGADVGGSAGAGGLPSAGSGGEAGSAPECTTHVLQAERGLCYEIMGRLSPYSCELPEAPRCFWLANEGLRPTFTLYGEYDTSYHMQVLSMSGGKCPTTCTRAGQ